MKTRNWGFEKIPENTIWSGSAKQSLSHLNLMQDDWADTTRVEEREKLVDPNSEYTQSLKSFTTAQQQITLFSPKKEINEESSTFSAGKVCDF